MARRAKPTRSSSRTTRSSRKRTPETIDLPAKEVTGSTSADKDTETASQTKNTKAGTDSTGARKTAATKPADVKTAAPKSDGPKIDPKPSTENQKPFGGDKASAQSPSDRPQFGRNADSRQATTSTSAKPDPVTTARSSSSKSSGFGFGTLLGSAVLGGLITIGGLGALGNMQNPAALPLVGSLFQSQTQDDAGDEASAQFAELQSRLEQLETAGAPTGPDPEIESRLQSIETGLRQLSEQPAADSASNENTEKLNELERQIADLGAALTASADGANPQLAADQTELGNRLSALENAVPQELTEAVQELDARLSEIAGTASEIAAKADANAQALAELAARTDQVEASVASVKTSEKVARSVAANLLGGALESGENLNVPIASVEALYGQSEESRRLTELSQAGIPSRQELIDEFDQFRDQVETQTAAPQAEDGNGFLNRLLISAKSLVKVRPAGPVEGDDASAILSRIRHHLEQGDLAKVDEEWQTLPQSEQEAGSAWIGRVKIRQEAIALFESLSSHMASE